MVLTLILRGYFCLTAKYPGSSILYQLQDNEDELVFYVQLIKQINKLCYNWNSLEEYIEQQIKDPLGGREFCCYSNVKDKMQELQGSDSNE